MDRSFRPFHTGGDADVAFAVVVLAAYFTTFSTLKTTSASDLLLMIGLGVAYIAIGIYGYALVTRSGKIAGHLAYFIIQLVLGGAIVYLGENAGYNAMVLLPLAGHSVMLLPQRLRAGVNILIVLTYILALQLVSGDWGMVWSGIPAFLAGQIFIVVFTQMAVSEEKARAEVELLVSELEGANQQLREYAGQVEELAITRERNRLAREIHDGVGHYLTTIHMQIQAARAVMGKNRLKADEALGRAQSMTQEALVDIRQSVAALRGAPVDSLLLPEEIKKMAAACESVGIQPQIIVLGGPRTISPQAFMTIYRAAQEGINNTLKHSHAQNISISVDYTRASQVRLSIQDDGVGAEKMNGGFGLLGMGERVRMVNGSLNVVTSPGSGFRLEVCVPG
jgi:signal transduction histidine kinase